MVIKKEKYKFISIFLICLLLVSCAKEDFAEKEKIEDSNIKENNFFGVWSIDEVALISNMYTGTSLDGDFEENIFDPEDYLGFEIEYTSQFFRLGSKIYNNPEYIVTYQTVGNLDSGGNFGLPDIYTFINEKEIMLNQMEKFENMSEIPLLRFDIKFTDDVQYEEFNFIPVGTQCILLNEDTMLVGIWGKVLLAHRADY